MNSSHSTFHLQSSSRVKTLQLPFGEMISDSEKSTAVLQFWQHVSPFVDNFPLLVHGLSVFLRSIRMFQHGLVETIVSGM
ncbi:hypothetical protein TNCV_1309481 [Trichonephila clavipes]|nr:hypothetical protein TNCV_1309481 [Trichonephila clavipes]